MDQEQPLSGKRMLIWSTGVIAGILILALFTQPVTDKRQKLRATLFSHYVIQRPELLKRPLLVSTHDSRGYLDLEVSLAPPADTGINHPGLACLERRPYSRINRLMKDLLTPNKPVVISLAQ